MAGIFLDSIVFKFYNSHPVAILSTLKVFNGRIFHKWALIFKFMMAVRGHG